MTRNEMIRTLTYTLDVYGCSAGACANTEELAEMLLSDVELARTIQWESEVK